MSLGQNIAKLRKSMGLTQEQLAEKCDVSRQAVAKWESGESEPAIAKLRVLSETFDTSIDELVKEDQEKKITRKKLLLDYSVYSLIAALTNDVMTNDELPDDMIVMSYQLTRSSVLAMFFEVLKTRYMDSNGRVFDEYLIENTSVEKREKSVKLLLSESGIARSAFQKYVSGEYEINDAFEEAEKCVSKQSDKDCRVWEEKNNAFVKKHESPIGIKYEKVEQIIHNMQNFEDYNEKKLMGIKKEIHDFVDGLDKDTQIERLMEFYLECAEEALDNENGEMLDELLRDWWKLKKFIWGKFDIDE